jgi:predicted nucleic acid-binding protein
LSAREVNLIPVTLPLWEQAARLRGLGLKAPDALHAANAISQQCALFITNGPVFYRVPNLPVVVLTDVLRTPT